LEHVAILPLQVSPSLHFQQRQFHILDHHIAQRVLLQLLKPEQLVELIPHPLELLSMQVVVQLI
jgi:hypothetical protein